MKRKTIKMSWDELIDNKVKSTEGYSTASQISAKLNLSISGIEKRMSVARRKGIVDAFQARGLNNRMTWFYKD